MSLCRVWAGETLVEVTQDHFREMDAINTRYNQQAQQIADRYQRARLDGGKTEKEPSSTLAKEMGALEESRKRDLSASEKKYSAAKAQAESLAARAKASASVPQRAGIAPSGAAGMNGSRPGASAPVMREEVVLDGSNVPREIEFARGGATSRAPASGEIGAGASVPTLEFSGPAAKPAAQPALAKPRVSAVGSAPLSRRPASATALKPAPALSRKPAAKPKPRSRR